MCGSGSTFGGPTVSFLFVCSPLFAFLGDQMSHEMSPEGAKQQSLGDSPFRRRGEAAGLLGHDEREPSLRRASRLCVRAHLYDQDVLARRYIGQVEFDVVSPRVRSTGDPKSA